MKSILSMLFLVTLHVGGYTTAVQAGDSQVMDDGSKQGQGQKEECLLVAVNCGTDYRTLELKIESLRNEIAKGSDVYSADELKDLGKRLDNANKTLEFDNKEGSGKWYKYPGE